MKPITLLATAGFMLAGSIASAEYIHNYMNAKYISSQSED